MDAMEANSPGNQKNIFLRFFENKLFQLSAVFYPKIRQPMMRTV